MLVVMIDDDDVDGDADECGDDNVNKDGKVDDDDNEYDDEVVWSYLPDKSIVSGTTRGRAFVACE